VDDSLTKKLLLRIRSEPPDPGWFDEVAAVVHLELQQDDRFLGDFKRSVGYLKLLAELDLLKGELEEEEDLGLGDTGSQDSWDGSSAASLLSGSDGGAVECTEGGGEAGGGRGGRGETAGGRGGELAELGAEIRDIDLARENGTGKQFVNYVIAVRRKEARWEVLRRYSDFFLLHQTLSDLYPRLQRIAFPGKKTFGNLERNVVAKRQRMLNDWFGALLRLPGLEHPGLADRLLSFLSPGWEASRQNVVERAVSAVSHDIQRSVKTVSSAVTAMPSNIVRNVDSALDGITKAFNVKDAEQEANNTKVGASIDADHDNIPMRITLLLLDEVFDLKDKNIWLRRQMITVLRQIVKTMLGDTVNRRIVDYFTTLTAPDAVAGYLNTIKDYLWPGGCPPAEPTARSCIGTMGERTTQYTC
jgi:sorting nexin-13